MVRSSAHQATWHRLVACALPAIHRCRLNCPVATSLSLTAGRENGHRPAEHPSISSATPTFFPDVLEPEKSLDLAACTSDAKPGLVSELVWRGSRHSRIHDAAQALKVSAAEDIFGGGPFRWMGVRAALRSLRVMDPWCLTAADGSSVAKGGAGHHEMLRVPSGSPANGADRFVSFAG